MTDVESWMDDDWLEGGETGRAVAVMKGGLQVDSHARAKDNFYNALVALHATGLRPAYNTLKQNVEFLGNIAWPESYGRVYNDNLLTTVRLYLMKCNQGVDYQPSEQHLHAAIRAVALANEFNPVADYLNGLEWDGAARIETMFGALFNCGVTPYTRGVSKAFMIGAVRRARRPGCKFDTMPILKSPQGWNKSTAVRVLFSAEFYSDAELGRLDNKDAAMALRGIWCQEFAEVGSLSHHEVNTLKAFMSRATDRMRDPWGRVTTDHPRTSVFMGTVNEGGYLRDGTGGRRFWPLTVAAPIDSDALDAVRDQLWAEAAAMEAAGESDVLDPSLWPIAAKHQDAETTADPWEDLIAGYLATRGEPDEDGTPSGRPANAIHTSEIYAALGVEAVQQKTGQSGRIRTIMESRLGWRYRHAVRIRGRIGTGFRKIDPAKGVGAPPEV